MFYRLFKILGLTFIFTLLLLVSLSSATDVRNSQTTIGVKGGIIGPCAFYVNDRDFESAMSYSIGGFVDYKLGPKILGGLSLDFLGVSHIYDENVSLIDLSATLKAMIFSPNSNLTFRPGFAIGYGSLGDFSFGASSHLLLKGGLEVVYSTEDSVTWLVEIMLSGSVDGGNEDFAMTFGPMVYVRGGLIF